MVDSAGIRLGMEVEVKCDEPGFKGSWYEARVVRCMQKTGRYSVEYDTLLSEEGSSKPLREIVRSLDVRPRPPRVVEPEVMKSQDRVEALHREGWWVGFIADRVGETSRYAVRFPDSNETLEFHRSDLRLHQHWDGRRWVSACASQADDEEQVVQDLEGTDSISEEVLQAGDIEDEIKGKSPHSSKRKTLEDEVNSLLHQKKSKKQASITGPVACQLATIEDESLSEIWRQYQISNSPMAQKRLRVKTPARKNVSSLSGIKKKQARAKGNLKVDENHMINNAEKRISIMSEEQLHKNLHASQSNNVVTPDCSSIKDLQVQVSPNSTEKTPNSRLEEIPNASPEVHIDEIINEGQNNCLPRSSGDQVKETNVEKTGVGCLSCGESSSKNLIMPFVKSSPMWKIVESAELFNSITQSPHFSPLGHYSEVLREGLAIGYMVSFANLADATCKLQIGDPRNAFEDKLSCIIDFEGHGFNVRPIRVRLEELLQINDKFLQFEDKLAKAERQILDQRQWKDHLHKELDTIDKEITMLKEKRASTVKMTQKAEMDIQHLQEEVETVQKASLDAKDDFKKVSTATWSAWLHKCG